MASSNAGPITGRERILTIIGGQRHWSSRTVVASILAAQSRPGARPIGAGVVVPPRGDELFEATQDGHRILMSGADLSMFLAGTGNPDAAPGNNLAGGITGAEYFVGLQNGQRAAFSVAEAVAIQTNTPTPTPSAMLMSSRLAPALTSQSNSTDGNSNTRISTYNETGATVTHGRLVYSAVRLTTANEGVAGTPMTVTAATEYPAGAVTRANAAGSPSMTLPVTGDAILVTDEFELSTPLPPGAQAYIRSYVTVPPGALWPQALTVAYTGATSLGELQDFATGVDKTDGSAITNVVPTTQKQAFAPVAFIATRLTGTPVTKSFVSIADSRGAGSGDKPEAGSVSRGNIGHLGKACAGRFPYLNMGCPGALVSSQTGSMSRRLAILAAINPTHIVVSYGTNDLLSGRTAAQIAADISTVAVALKAARPAVKIIVETVLPDTTSTDFFATAAGQTITASPAGAFTGGSASERSKLNNLIRAGLAGVDFVFDAADLIEVDINNNLTRDGGLWRSGNGGTGTGYNATYLGTTGATSASTTDGRHVWMSTITGSGKGGTCILRDAYIAAFAGY